MAWYVYRFGPVDYFEGTVTLDEWVANEGDDGIPPTDREAWRGSVVVALLDAMKAEWGTLDHFRAPHRVGVLPVDEEAFEPYLVAKLDNNGTTYVVASRELPWLGEPIRPGKKPKLPWLEEQDDAGKG